MFGVRNVCVQSPLEVQANLDAMRKGHSTIMISTPTFLRSYYKKGSPDDFATMRGVIGGAEKTPDGFIDMWRKKFPDVYYWEGYGLTEASPVVCVNLPPNLKRGRFCPQPSQTKAKSVGEVFPGMQCAVSDPDTGEFLPIGSTGLLNLRGPNIFAGYYKQPEENSKKLREDGWLNTGDLAQLDEDGFIFIKGRLSRFSKIGGEMVPHMSVEDSIVRALGIQDSEKPLIAIGSKIDPAKGEALILLSAVDIDMPQLRRLLTEAGLPNLWIPKHTVR
ncbi:MAG: AMP-binding protein [Bacilli bacterium]